MGFMKDFINNPSYVWVPIVAFVVITIIAGLIGFWNGWKTSLYFFGWNLVGVIVGVFVTSPIMKAFNGIEYLKVVSASAEALWGMLILFVFMLGVNFIAFLFYWIFRSKLKKSMKDNKKAKKSNLSSRFIGMGIAITSASPAAFFLTDATAVMSTENGFTKFADAVARAYTGGKYDGTSEDRVIAGNIDTIQDLAKSFGGKDGLKPTQETKDKVQKILDTDFTKNVDSIYDSIKQTSFGDDIKGDDIKKVAPKTITDNAPALGIQLSPQKESELKASLTKIFESEQNALPAEAAQALINKLKLPLGTK